MVLPGRHLDGASLAGLIKSEAVTVAVRVATVWLGLVEHLEATGGQTPSLKRVVVGGAPLTPALMARIGERLAVTVQTSLGVTELSPAGTFARPDDPNRSAEKSGRPAIGVDLLSGGICNSDDFASVKERMARFMAAGFREICEERARVRADQA